MAKSLLVVKYPDGGEKCYDYLYDWTPQRDDIFSDGENEWYVDRVVCYDGGNYDIFVVPFEDDNE